MKFTAKNIFISKFIIEHSDTDVDYITISIQVLHTSGLVSNLSKD